MRSISLLLILSTFTIWSCTTTKRINELNATCCQHTADSFAEGRVLADSLDKIILTVVLAEKDQKFLKNKTCQVFNLTEKADKDYLQILERDFVILKLASDQFRDEIEGPKFYSKGEQKLVDNALDSSKSFIFISSSQHPSVYRPTFLDDKEEIKDLLWVKFGP